MSSRRELFGEWRSELSLLSASILAVGALSVVVGLGGTLLFLASEGFTPYQNLVSSLTSPFQGAILLSSIILGLVAAVAGFTTFRRAATKAAREASIAGAVLGVQSVIFSGFLLLFREAEKFPIFVRQFFDFEILSEFWGTFWRSALNTVTLAFAAQLLGMVIGLVLAMMVLSNRITVRAPARVYINLFRGTPLLVQLSVGYFGIAIGLQLPNLSVYRIGIIILGLNAGAYSAEIFRAGIQSIERGQLEASRSLGMSYLQAMRYVILPQAVRRVIPPLTNEFVILIKDTSLIAFLGFTFGERELLAWAVDTYGETANATAYIAAVSGYLVITLPLIRLVTMLERKLRSGLVGIGA
jgi:His/Glu/Gln/Arg/opine family amino acid ABC transporter permease subunit